MTKENANEYWHERVRELTRPLVGRKIDRENVTYQDAMKSMYVWMSGLIGREVSDIGQLKNDDCFKIINEIHSINARRQK